MDRKSRAKKPDDYINAIANHAARDMHTSLHPGVNYRHLAKFLRLTRQPSPNHQLQRQRERHQPKYPFVVIHDLAYCHGDSQRVTSFDGYSGLDDFAKHPFPESGSGHIVFIHGYPSREWVAGIGARYGVDPEVYHRYRTPATGAEFYDLPALPSASTNIISLCVASVGKHHNSLRGGPDNQLDNQTSLVRHFRTLDRVGESVVREFSVHDEEHFSIEQNILVHVTTKRSGGWNALVHLDVGRTLDQGINGPWSGIPYSMHSDVFLPVIQCRPKASLAEHHTWASLPSAEPSRFTQSASLLSHESYGRFLAEDMVRLDAFYALNEVFFFAASAENQFLNLLSAKLVSSVRNQYSRESMTAALSSLNFHKTILERHMERLRGTVRVIEGRGSPYWPSVLTPSTTTAHQSNEPQSPLKSGSGISPSVCEEIQGADRALLADYNYLLHRSQHLSSQYQGAAEHLRNSVMMEESKRAIEQAQGVGRLTLLAFFFVPLGFTTSFFSMSFKELDSGLSLWVWFVMSVPVLALALFICFWSQIGDWFLQIRASWRAE